MQWTEKYKVEENENTQVLKVYLPPLLVCNVLSDLAQMS